MKEPAGTFETIEKLLKILNSLGVNAAYFSETARNLSAITVSDTDDLRDAVNLSDDLTDLAKEVQKELKKNLKIFLENIS